MAYNRRTMKKLKILSLTMILCAVGLTTCLADRDHDHDRDHHHGRAESYNSVPTSSNVPDAGSTAAMLGLTMAGLYLVGRKNLKKHA